MSNLTVHNVDPEIVQALKERAAMTGASVEEAHRHLLYQALVARQPPISLAEVLGSMPNVGADADFER
ncbi:FitA-like ribbon-helix-helix domain-containing protein [Chromobacterium violaceum]|uniref:FitA-like ribbon-helix-helix domain-containing protein n=1 Tax=Chromobacterium violaceum TaxID=536 RepID=UPI001B31E42E|nr:hypothetical protein [Chromobacterium violaceum]MBP4043491.1 hypothetical protein [Chromobacterium violaceum]